MSKDSEHDKTCIVSSVRLARLIRRIQDDDDSLKSIDLSEKKIGDQNVRLICGALRDNKTVRTLHLCGNAISDKGAVFLSEMLCCNKSLEEVDLSYNDIGISGFSRIAEAIFFNRHSRLRRVYSQRNSIENNASEFHDIDLDDNIEDSKNGRVHILNSLLSGVFHREKEALYLATGCSKELSVVKEVDSSRCDTSSSVIDQSSISKHSAMNHSSTYTDNSLSYEESYLSYASITIDESLLFHIENELETSFDVENSAVRGACLDFRRTLALVTEAVMRKDLDEKAFQQKVSLLGKSADGVKTTLMRYGDWMSNKVNKEIEGMISDVNRSYNQVKSVFELRQRDIDAVTSEIEEAISSVNDG